VRLSRSRREYRVGRGTVVMVVSSLFVVLMEVSSWSGISMVLMVGLS
jgi:hypothetical protein